MCKWCKWFDDRQTWERSHRSLLHTVDLASKEKKTRLCVHIQRNSPSINSVHIDILFSTKKALKKVMMYGESHCNQKKRSSLWRKWLYNYLSKCCLIKKMEHWQKYSQIKKKKIYWTLISCLKIFHHERVDLLFWLCNWGKSGVDHVYCMKKTEPQNWPCRGFLIQT